MAEVDDDVGVAVGVVVGLTVGVTVGVAVGMVVGVAVGLNVAHPESAYASPSEEHMAADGVPKYPAAHALSVNVTSKLGTSRT